MSETEPHFKVPTKVVPSDDCAIHLGRRIEDGKVVDAGDEHFLHRGEWVEVLPVGAVSQLMAFGSFMRIGRDGETDNEKLMSSEEQFSRMVSHVASRVVKWNWTGLDGEPLPQPYKNESLIASLHADELLWLVNATNNETAGERKNASEPSTTN